MARKEKYFVVNSDCSEKYTNLQKAVNEIRRGLLGDSRTTIYSLKNVTDVQELGSEDIVAVYENCKKL